jgi:hypothetical protein
MVIYWNFCWICRLASHESNPFPFDECVQSGHILIGFGYTIDTILWIYWMAQWPIVLVGVGCIGASLGSSWLSADVVPATSSHPCKNFHDLGWIGVTVLESRKHM